MSKLKYDEGAIAKMLNQGRRVEEVSVALDVPEVYIRRYFSHLRVDGWQKPLGSKEEAYYETEEEMLREPVYTYDSLSDSEKAIYDKMKGEN